MATHGFHAANRAILNAFGAGMPRLCSASGIFSFISFLLKRANNLRFNIQTYQFIY